MNNNNTAQWPISNDDKKVILDLGRKLHKFILEYANANKQPNGGFHWKLMAGAFQYVEGVMGQKQAMLAEDVLVLHDTVERYELGNRIEEPFQPTPAPTVEEMRVAAQKKIDEGKAEIEMLDAAAAPVAPLHPGEGEVPVAPVSNVDATPDSATVPPTKTEAVPSPYPAGEGPGAATA